MRSFAILKKIAFFFYIIFKAVENKIDESHKIAFNNLTTSEICSKSRF